MSFLWNQIGPNDQYIVKTKRPISISEIGFVSHLYQPIIGHTAFSLYLALYFEIKEEHYSPEYGLHRYLISTLSIPLHQVIQARYLLEAVGLLKTYQLKDQEENTYWEYEIYPPLSPYAFFSSDVLSIILLNRVGKERYKRIRQRYLNKQSQAIFKERQEITRSFNDVFSSLSPTELIPQQESKQFLLQLDKQAPLAPLEEVTGNELSLNDQVLDISFIKHAVPDSIRVQLNKQVVEELKQISFLYQLNEVQLIRFLQDPTIYSPKDELNLDKLRQNLKAWYRKTFGGIPPQITEKEAASFRTETKDLSKEEAHMETLKTISPLRLMELHQKGGKVAQPDVGLLESLLIDFKLAPEVVNVLIEYVMITNDYKLPRNLVEKIAAHWKRNNIQTVTEALQMARKEHQIYKKWNESSGKAAKNRGRRHTKKSGHYVEKLPSTVSAQLQRGEVGQEETYEGPDEEILKILYELQEKEKGKRES
ncbi:DnaD domain protein [Microaerobacter geothermalis]|uniref:replication initiation and membrane attachment family protein n=1 Tax=Microaerobacter geothermalis TaxID=674972 RepID=UPI001F25FAB1|nr:DnaD domain protein [Microaerobacter geothermalis]MCF6092977.1 DnaD domain protein [Microaerobacter geothermalis]